ncbi:KICSTOR complex protein ITFG2 [Geodia barretti]|uniref:KICSTOR complex protein ITFG2 n=1 Tax=Geodia barretti TaxID=519541 RepID=A0AA35W0C6_GEOBA|nr:KICSTOR complex protein ITFG2 [Geodia barretti]
MMRSVSFVDRLEFEFAGNHSSHGLCLGDVDGDGLNELVVGSVDGVLAIFKEIKNTKPWRKCSDLGMITSVAVGDILNKKKNLVIVSTTEGLCHIFDFHQNQTNSGKGSSEEGSKTGTGIRPIHSQYLSLNVKTLLVDCIDPGGAVDVFVGHTDRAVGAYRWDSDTHSLVALTERLPLNGQVGSLSVGVVPGRSGGCGQLLVSQAGGTCIPLVYSSSHTPRDGNGTKTGNRNETETGAEAGAELPSNGWMVELTYQKGSVDGIIGVVQRRNPIVGTEIVGNITPAPQSIDHSSSSSSSSGNQVGRKGDGTGLCGTLTALCTLDGSIKLLKDENKQWELQVDHSIFSLHCLDTTGCGGDEIVGCAWDGMTYIVDQKRNVVKFNFGENVCAFSAGKYGCEGRDVPCLVYTTFHGQIFIYRNVTLPSIPSTNMLQSLKTNVSSMSNV